MNGTPAKLHTTKIVVGMFGRKEREIQGPTEAERGKGKSNLKSYTLASTPVRTTTEGEVRRS